MNCFLPGELSSKVQEWLLEVVVALGRYLVILEVLLPVECYLLGLDLPVLHINFIPTKNNWDVFTNPAKITVPCWNILVCQSCCDIKHDDSTLSMDAATKQNTLLYQTQTICNSYQ